MIEDLETVSLLRSLGYRSETAEEYIAELSRRVSCCNEDSAVKCFERYRKCKDVYWKTWISSGDMERLTVRDAF